MFRSEVIEKQRYRLTGSVQIAVPISWSLLITTMFTLLASLIVFLLLGSYSRVETVSGVIEPETGVAEIFPSRPGTLTRLFVRENDYVMKDTPLVAVQAGEAASGPSIADQVASSLKLQGISLDAQRFAAQDTVSSQLEQLSSQRTGLVAEIDALESQAGLQRSLVKSASEELERLRPLQVRGFINARDYRSREDSLLSRQQQLSQLVQSIGSRKAALQEARSKQSEIVAQAKGQIGSIAIAQAQLVQQAAVSAGTQTYAINAPVTGRITAISARPGQFVQPSAILMSIVPQGSVLQASLKVPTSAIGFIKVGQKVRVSIDAFPYQQFGVILGHVQTVASSPVVAPSELGAPSRSYPVKVVLDRPEVLAFGRRERLLPGMTLSARIVTRKQSLVEWLLNPILAVQNR